MATLPKHVAVWCCRYSLPCRPPQVKVFPKFDSYCCWRSYSAYVIKTGPSLMANLFIYVGHTTAPMCTLWKARLWWRVRYLGVDNYISWHLCSKNAKIRSNWQVPKVLISALLFLLFHMLRYFQEQFRHHNETWQNGFKFAKNIFECTSQNIMNFLLKIS